MTSANKQEIQESHSEAQWLGFFNAIHLPTPTQMYYVHKNIHMSNHMNGESSGQTYRMQLTYTAQWVLLWVTATPICFVGSYLIWR